MTSLSLIVDKGSQPVTAAAYSLMENWVKKLFLCVCNDSCGRSHSANICNFFIFFGKKAKVCFLSFFVFILVLCHLIVNNAG